jgi:hypothetical protein
MGSSAVVAAVDGSGRAAEDGGAMARCGDVERPRRAKRFAQLIDRRVRVVGGPAVRAACGDSAGLSWLPGRCHRGPRRLDSGRFAGHMESGACCGGWSRRPSLTKKGMGPRPRSIFRHGVMLVRLSPDAPCEDAWCRPVQLVLMSSDGPRRCRSCHGAVTRRCPRAGDQRQLPRPCRFAAGVASTCGLVGEVVVLVLQPHLLFASLVVCAAGAGLVAAPPS